MKLVATVGFESTTHPQVMSLNRACTREVRGQVRRERQTTSLPTALPVRPICTPQRAGVSAGIRKPFVGHRRGYGSRIPNNGLRSDGVEQVNKSLVSHEKEQRLLCKPASTPRSRRGDDYLAQPSLIRLWEDSRSTCRISWLKMTPTGGAGSPSSRKVAAMANSEKQRLTS